MSGNTAETRMVRHWYSPGRIILGLLLGLLAGWIVCEWLAHVLETQPIYRLHGASNDPFSVSCVGPWLLIHEKDTQFRRISDGELVKRIEYDYRQETSFFYCVNHPQLGAETLIGFRQSLINTTCAIMLLQPLTGEERVIHQWNRNDKSVQLSHTGKHFTVTRVIPLTPLLALRIDGLPGAVSMGFYHYLGHGDFSAFKMTLVQVYSSLNGQLLGSCALPCQLGIHVVTTLLDDGRHLLLSCRTFSDRLGQYFLGRTDCSW